MDALEEGTLFSNDAVLYSRQFRINNNHFAPSTLHSFHSVRETLNPDLWLIDLWAALTGEIWSVTAGSCVESNLSITGTFDTVFRYLEYSLFLNPQSVLFYCILACYGLYGSSLPMRRVLRS